MTKLTPETQESNLIDLLQKACAADKDLSLRQFLQNLAKNEDFE